MKRKRVLSVVLAGALAASGCLGNWVPKTVQAAQELQPVLKVSFDQENAADESGFGSNGTVVGNPEYVDGVIGKAIHFQNPEDRSQTATKYVNFGTPDNLLFSDGDFSVAFWYQSDGDCQKEGAVVSNKDWSNGGNAGFNLGDMKEGINWNFNTVESVSKGRVEVGRYPAATDGTWHHVTGVVDRTDEQIRLYIDGEEIASKSTQGWVGTVDVTDFVLGADGVKKRGVEDAYVDELYVYKDALEKEDVQELMIDGEILLAVSEMEEKLAQLAEDDRYTQEAIEEMEDTIQKAKEEFSGKDTAQKQAILADLKEAFELFVESIWTPVLAVSFDNENAEDGSGNGNHGTLVGGPEFTEGVKGKAIHLVNPEERTETATQYVNFGQPESLQLGTGSFSILFWYKADSVAGGAEEGSVISNKNWASGDNPGFNIGHMAQGLNLNFNTVGSGKGRAETDRFSKAVGGEWHHVAAVVDRDEKNQIALYIDGKPASGGSGSYGTKTYTADISSYTGTVDVMDLVLGADGEKKRGVEDAYIDELCVYKDAVSVNFIQRMAQDGALDLEILQMEEIISQAEPGCRHSQEDITAIKEQVSQAKEQMKTADAQEREAIVETLRESYEEFLEGNEPNTVFHLFSDPHVTSVTGTAGVNLAAGLEDMKRINPQASALISVGDNTQNGTESEMNAFYQVLEEHSPLDEDGKTLIALGNHDVRGPGQYWEDFPSGENAYWSTIYNLYMGLNGKYMPQTQGKTYYDYWADGYHLIVLNPENSPKDTAYLTETQLAWLEEKLSENEDPAKPAIVIVHQALNDTHWRSTRYNGFGPQDEAVKEILQKHPQTILVSGHIHNGFGVTEAIDRPYGTMVDVPAFQGSSKGLSDAGTGYEVYVYDDEILFRARNFLTSTWLPQYDLSVKLKSLPVLTSEAKSLAESEYTEDSWALAEERLNTAVGQTEELMNRTYEQQYDTIPEGLYHKDTRREIENLQDEFVEIFSLLVKKPDSELTLEEALALLEEARQEADNARKEAQQAQQTAAAIQEEADKKLQEAKERNEEAKIALEEAKDLQEQAGIDSEEAKKALADAEEKAAQAAQAQSEAAKSQTAAETAREEARQMLARAEAAMEESKRLAALAEEKAAQAEADRKKAEEERKAAEEAKKQAEAERKAAEEAQKKMEAERAAIQEAAKQAEAAQKAAQQAKEELEKLKAQLGQKENGQEVSVKKVSLKAAKSQKKRELKVTWKKVAGVSGYQVQYSANAKFKNAKTKKLKAAKTSLKLKKLKSKKTYYVRVRAYKKTKSGVVYGSYSKVKKGKVK